LYACIVFTSTGWWFSPGSPVSSTNKTDLHDINEILVNVALNTIKQINTQTIGNQWLSLLKFGVHFLYLVRCNGYSLHDIVSEWLLFNAKPAIFQARTS